jgi:hypothetical protein
MENDLFYNLGELVIIVGREFRLLAPPCFHGQLIRIVLECGGPRNLQCLTIELAVIVAIAIIFVKFLIIFDSLQSIIE